MNNTRKRVTSPINLPPTRLPSLRLVVDGTLCDGEDSDRKPRIDEESVGRVDLIGRG